MALDKIVAGDSLSFLDYAPNYPPADGWTMKYRLTPIFTTTVQAPVTLTAVTEGNGYRITASPGTTGTWDAGSYSWARWVEKPGARVTLDPIGNAAAPLAPLLQVLPNPASSVQGYDPRSYARRALEALEAGATTHGANAYILEYTIAGRTMRFADQGQFEAKRTSLKAEVWREGAGAAMAAGLPNPRQIRVRFGRA